MSDTNLSVVLVHGCLKLVEGRIKCVSEYRSVQQGNLFTYVHIILKQNFDSVTSYLCSSECVLETCDVNWTFGLSLCAFTWFRVLSLEGCVWSISVLFHLSLR